MDWFTPPRPRITIDEEAVTLVTMTRRGPPWRYRYDPSVTHWVWRDVVRVTVNRWDMHIVDAIGMEFEFRNGDTFIVTEDDLPDFYPTMERILPKALPGIMPPDDWYAKVYAGPNRQCIPAVIFDDPARTAAGRVVEDHGGRPGA